MPLVSAIVPNFNHARFLEQRIESVLGQTHPDLEVILLDDASTDNSRDIIERYSSLVRRVLFNANNSGNPFHQWNAGVRLAQGEYLWFAESDDAAEPTLVESLLRAFKRHPTAGIAYAASDMLDERGARFGRLEFIYADLGPARWRADYFAHGSEECAQCLCIRNTIPNASGVLIRRSMFERAGGADESFTMCGDWKLWASVLRYSDIAYIAQPLNLFRQHAQSVRERKRDVALLESLRVMSYIADIYSLPPEKRHDAARRLSRYWFWLARHRKVSLHAQRKAIAIARELDPHIELRLAQAIPDAAARRLRRWRGRSDARSPRTKP